MMLSSAHLALALAIPWTRALMQLVLFVGYFGAFGALGFRFFVVQTRSPRSDSALALFSPQATRTAALIGLVGSLLLLPNLLAAKQISGVRIGLAVLLAIAFAMALARMRGVWEVAAALALGFTFQSLFKTAKWAAVINPLHMVAASLWIGTLFVLVVAGLSAVAQGRVPREDRGPLVARLVSRFSNLALVSVSLLILTGLITAWLHLKYPAALWTTAYGITLLVKLCVVAIVAGLGAWNWRRVSPTLGTEAATTVLRRSSTAEITFGAIVLVITALLVSLPSPKLPQPAAVPERQHGPARETGSD